MKGLILKDFYSMKIYTKTMVLLLIVYAAMGLYSRNVAFLGSFLGVLCVILSTTSFTYDKYYKWDEYAVSLPVRRRTIVLAKYISTVLIILAAVLFTIVLSSLLELFDAHTISMEFLQKTFLTNYLTTGIFLLFPAILLPIMFKFGPDKGRIAMFIVVGGMSLLVVALGQLASMYLPNAMQDLKALLNSDASLLPVLLVLPLLILVVFILSYFIACAVYKRREF